MLFSIVIAVRNEVKYIEKCLDSVFNQDFRGIYEVLVVDGMSNDGTSELLKKLQKKYDFKLFKNSKINAAAGRNIGIKNSKGKLIVFVDGDAIPQTNWLSQINNVFKKNNNVIGVGGPELIPEDSSNKGRNIGLVMTSSLARGGRLNPSTQHTFMKDERYVEHIPTCNLCLKREVFNKVGMFDEKFVKGQDLELNYRITKAGYKLLYSPRISVIHYRKTHLKDFMKQIYKWAKAKVAIIKKHGLNGLTSHIYLWPLYFLFFLFLTFSIFFIFNLLNLFFFFFLLGFILYMTIIFSESGRLSKKYKNKKLFFYTFFLLPIVHISYSFGVLTALIKKNIW
jgi:GT2 family glycosyltransferase